MIIFRKCLFRVRATARALYLKFFNMENFVKFLPTHISINWKSFDDFLARSECPFLFRAEYCERCDGYFPVCSRPDMRPIRFADPIGEYVRQYMHCVNEISNLRAISAPEAKTK